MRLEFGLKEEAVAKAGAGGEAAAKAKAKVKSEKAKAKVKSEKAKAKVKSEKANKAPRKENTWITWLTAHKGLGWKIPRFQAEYTSSSRRGTLKHLLKSARTTKILQRREEAWQS